MSDCSFLKRTLLCGVSYFYRFWSHKWFGHDLQIPYMNGTLTTVGFCPVPWRGSLHYWIFYYPNAFKPFKMLSPSSWQRKSLNFRRCVIQVSQKCEVSMVCLKHIFNFYHEPCISNLIDIPAVQKIVLVFQKLHSVILLHTWCACKMKEIETENQEITAV
jgi:hypothetical protein